MSARARGPWGGNRRPGAGRGPRAFVRTTRGAEGGPERRARPPPPPLFAARSPPLAREVVGSNRGKPRSGRPVPRPLAARLRPPFFRVSRSSPCSSPYSCPAPPAPPSPGTSLGDPESRRSPPLFPHRPRCPEPPIPGVPAFPRTRVVPGGRDTRRGRGAGLWGLGSRGPSKFSAERVTRSSPARRCDRGWAIFGDPGRRRPRKVTLSLSAGPGPRVPQRPDPVPWTRVPGAPRCAEGLACGMRSKLTQASASGAATARALRPPFWMPKIVSTSLG